LGGEDIKNILIYLQFPKPEPSVSNSIS